MADKTIPELQLISGVTDGLNFATDNSTQSYRATALQIFNFFKSKTWLQTTQIKTINYTVVAADSMILGNCTGGSIDITLHTAVGYTGKVVQIMHVGTANSVVIKTTSAQTISGRASGVTKLNLLNDFIEVVSDGSNWHIVKIRETLAFNWTNQSGQTLPNDGSALGNNVLFDTKYYDYGDLYDDGTGLVTVPVTGLFGFTSSLISSTSLNPSWHWEMLAVRDPGGSDEVQVKDWFAGNGSANTVESLKIAGTVKLEAGETFAIQAAGIGQTMGLATGIENLSSFSFWKIA